MTNATICIIWYMAGNYKGAAYTKSGMIRGGGAGGRSPGQNYFFEKSLDKMLHSCYNIVKKREKSVTQLHICHFLRKRDVMKRFFNGRFFVSVLAVLVVSALSAQAIYGSEYDGYGYDENEQEEYDDYEYGYGGDEAREFITTGNLNLRSGPAINYPRLTLLPAGTVIVVTEFNPEGFSAVTFGDMLGYVSTEFIEPLKPREAPEAAPPPVPAAINGNIEKLPWAQMREIMPTGTTLQIYDINTGLTYFVRNFSNGNHADVETLTRQDTDTMRATSGGRFSWDARPVLVTFNGRTFAAAIHTMPHAGYTISGNGMNGHVCLHFFGSAPHNGNRAWQAEMQAAVTRAFNSR